MFSASTLSFLWQASSGLLVCVQCLPGFALSLVPVVSVPSELRCRTPPIDVYSPRWVSTLPRHWAHSLVGACVVSSLRDGVQTLPGGCAQSPVGVHTPQSLCTLPWFVLVITWNTSFQTLLARKVSFEKSADSLMELLCR